MQIAVEALAGLGYGPDLPSDFYAVLDALVAEGWLRDPAEVDAARARVAELEAVAEAARTNLAVPRALAERRLRDALEAAGFPVRPDGDLDAVPAADTTSESR